jgi:hypothetical protein
MGLFSRHAAPKPHKWTWEEAVAWAREDRLANPEKYAAMEAAAEREGKHRESSARYRATHVEEIAKRRADDKAADLALAKVNAERKARGLPPYR